MMKAVIEDYIYDKTGKRVKIVFDDAFKIRLHAQMLTNAYAYVMRVHYKNKD
jgi:hypothetical protein